MTRGEEAIIKGFLMGAYKAVQDARTHGDEKLACAESASIRDVEQALRDVDDGDLL